MESIVCVEIGARFEKRAGAKNAPSAGKLAYPDGVRLPASILPQPHGWGVNDGHMEQRLLKPMSLPSKTMRAPGTAESAKSTSAGPGAAWTAVTVSPTVTVCSIEPLVACTVMVVLPAGVSPAVLTVSVEEPDAGTLVGANAAVAPAGRPETASETEPSKPFWPAIEKV